MSSSSLLASLRVVPRHGQRRVPHERRRLAQVEPAPAHPAGEPAAERVRVDLHPGQPLQPLQDLPQAIPAQPVAQLRDKQRAVLPPALPRRVLQQGALRWQVKRRPPLFLALAQSLMLLRQIVLTAQQRRYTLLSQ